MRSRALEAAGVVAATVALCGCEATGTLDFGASTVDVDLTLTRPGFACTAQALRSTLAAEARPDGSCHISGSLPCRSSSYVALVSPFATQDARQTIVAIPASAFRSRAPQSLDVTLTFDGPVRTAGAAGTVSGDAVRYTDPAALAEHGIVVVADHRPPVPVAPLAGLGGLLAGAALGWIWTRRRSRAGAEGRR